MVMRQMAYRLESMLPLEDDLPSQAGIDAECILNSLSRQPESMLRPDLVKVMQNLQMPLNYISDTEVEDLKRTSSLSKAGLKGALGLLIRSPDELTDIEEGLDLRAAIAVTVDAMQKNTTGDREVLGEMWDMGCNGLMSYLVQHLLRLASDLHSYFGAEVPARHCVQQATTRFHTCRELSALMSYFRRSDL